MIEKNTKKGFTLLEVIIVLGMTIVLLSFGVVGVNDLRKSLELRNGYTDFVSQFKSIQNEAKNSIIDNNGDLPTYYAISFNDNNYSTEYCYDNVGIIQCSVFESNIKPARFGNITYTSTCTGGKIGFKRLSTHMVTLSGPTASSTGSCVIKVGRTGSTKTLNISINFDENTISYN